MLDTQTLPGWPAVYDPSMLELLFLTVLLPVGIGLLFALVILGPGWRQKEDS